MQDKLWSYLTGPKQLQSRKMTSGQPKTAKTSETVEIIEQVVQKMISGQSETAKTSETFETAMRFETAGMYTPLLSYSLTLF